MTSPATQTPMRSFARAVRSKMFWILAGVVACLVVREAVLQRSEDAYVEETAWRVVREAHAETPRERVIALRDYVRATVAFAGAPTDDDDRPFFRASAAETLQSGLGWCGEDSRAFINLARAIGIEAQRVNLYGSMMHVVAEVELVPHQRLVVDAQSPPHIRDLELLDDVIRRPEFDDYYTLNLRRLHMGWLVSRIRFEMGPLTYWAENPHALAGALWALLFAGIVFLRGARVALRIFLHRRGWVHRSTLPRDSSRPLEPDDAGASVLPASSARPTSGAVPGPPIG